jgi:uncharacterized protein (TIGR02996 family)
LEETRWLVLADWLEENDDPRRGELLRLHRRLLATCCEPEQHPERAQWQSRVVELIGEGVRPCVPRKTLLLPGDVPMTFSFIPPGKFRMGSALMDAHESEKPEAEWEYACRAGTSTEYHFGDVINADLANYNENFSWNGSPEGEYRKQTTEVGAFLSNAWGLFDIHGNVLEWCVDWYSPYSAEDQTDPRQLNIQSDECRVLRGGSWGSLPDGCRAAFRIRSGSARRGSRFGFRVCFRLD